MNELDELRAEIAKRDDQLFAVRAIATALVGMTAAMALRMGARQDDVATFSRCTAPGADVLAGAEAAIRITNHLVQMGSAPRGRA